MLEHPLPRNYARGPGVLESRRLGVYRAGPTKRFSDLVETAADRFGLVTIDDQWAMSRTSLHLPGQAVASDQARSAYPKIQRR
jgi:hypothetical protein